MRLLSQICLVSLGSMLGGLLRWGVSVASVQWLGTAFPWGTFFINITGSFFLGWFLATMEQVVPENWRFWLRPVDLHLMVAVGFTGAYTTFSTFESEAHYLMTNHEEMKSLVYMAASVILGLAAVHGGIRLAKWL